VIEKTISQIEAKVRGAESVGDAHKAELLGLLGKLKSEVGALAQTNSEQAQSIADSVHASTKAATGENQNPEALENSVAGLRSTVEGFEKSHPQLVQVVNSLSNTLANLGI
jgi:ABC-type transporter Mla subunit MlaD